MGIKKFVQFINEESAPIGRRENDEINRLIDLMGKRDLTPEEKKLLDDLGNGKKLPEPTPPKLKTHKTGGFLFNDEGDVMTEEETESSEDEEGKEFVTSRGKSKGVSVGSVEKPIETRVYRNRDSEERMIYSFENGRWKIYRSGGKTEFGMFLDESSPLYKKYENTPPAEMWKSLEGVYDMGMILDKGTYDEFSIFCDLFYEDQRKNRSYLQQLHKKLKTLL